jgi:hypothetical protein
VRGIGAAVGAILVISAIAGCGSDDSSGAPSTAADGDGGAEEVAGGDGIEPGEQSDGSGTVTIGDTTWEIDGTCNRPTEGVVLLTGTAVGDPTTEIYVTATPGIPDSASAYVTDTEQGFDWQTGSSYNQFGVDTPDTSYDGGTGRGEATFVDLAQPTLDPVLANGSWEFSC